MQAKGGFKSEDTGKILRLQHKYSKSLSWTENLNKLFIVLGGKFKFSAQDCDLEYLCWKYKNPLVSSDLKPPLEFVNPEIGYLWHYNQFLGKNCAPPLYQMWVTLSFKK